jgi:carboxyl-terminal processing protease
MRVQPGEPVEVTLRPREPCTLDAWRNDGLFRALALPELVELEPGEDLDLTMVLPEERMGGMGFQFQPLDDSVAVRRVYEDTPAWNAGLRSGDRILAVDGEPTDDMDPNDFVILGTGPEGSVVHLEVEHEDGSVVEVDIERALLN